MPMIVRRAFPSRTTITVTVLLIRNRRILETNHTRRPAFVTGKMAVLEASLVSDKAGAN